MSDANRSALITGASGGIGLELARLFAEHDLDLIVAGEDQELTAAAGSLDRADPQIEAVRVETFRTPRRVPRAHQGGRAPG